MTLFIILEFVNNCINKFNFLSYIILVILLFSIRVLLVYSLQEKHVKENQVIHWKYVIKLQERLKQVLTKV